MKPQLSPAPHYDTAAIPCGCFLWHQNFHPPFIPSVSTNYIWKRMLHKCCPRKLGVPTFDPIELLSEVWRIVENTSHFSWSNKDSSLFCFGTVDKLISKLTCYCQKPKFNNVHEQKISVHKKQDPDQSWHWWAIDSFAVLCSYMLIISKWSLHFP